MSGEETAESATVCTIISNHAYCDRVAGLGPRVGVRTTTAKMSAAVKACCKKGACVSICPTGSGRTARSGTY